MKSPPTWAAGAGERRRSALALHKEKKRAQDVFHTPTIARGGAVSNVNRSSGPSAGSLEPSCQSNKAVAAQAAETAINDARLRDVVHNQTHRSSSAQEI